MTTDFLQLEFHRVGLGLLPSSGDKDPGVALYFPSSPGSTQPWRSCTCVASKEKTCAHVRRLMKLIGALPEKASTGAFEKSLWNRLAQILVDGNKERFHDVRVTRLVENQSTVLRFASSRGEELAHYFDDSPARTRLLERMGKTDSHLAPFSDRAGLLQKLSLHLRTLDEHTFNAAGLKSNRQTLEESFWGRLAYHAFREFGERQDLSFHAAIDEDSGNFTLTVKSTNGQPILRLVVPRTRVRSILHLLAREFPGDAGLAIHPIPLKSIFKVSATTELDLEVRPVILALQASGEARFLEKTELEKFRYGDLVYVKELSLLAELESPGRERRFASPVAMTLKRSQVPSFLDAHRAEIEDGAFVLDDSLTRLKIIKEYDYVEMVPEALSRSWYWLSIRYGWGSHTVSLAEILRAREEGRDFLETPGGWIDLRAPAFSRLPGAPGEGESVRLSAAQLLKLAFSTERPVRVEGDGAKKALLARLIALQPSEPFSPLVGLRTSLRPYQKIGVEWLTFLFENRLAGLLCDDMGLGKTHQAMALMTWLRERRNLKEPCLVVCPTTVVPHWRNKLREYAPGLTAVSYHGSPRSIAEALGEGNVILTSYGILRNDVAELQKIPFSVAIFDEIQNLKNRETLSYHAACAITAEMKLGLTGTPIENSLSDLKSLFDLILPGYLGSDEEFAEQHGKSTERLRRTIAPFVLRRLKTDVLDELPEKIEDLRTATLTEEQVKLYRDALATRGRRLVEEIRSSAKPLPYIHVFALLNLLKQICDHPALVEGDLDGYEKYGSGKWELFKELLFESLDSGQKVVVFSQYLGMIGIMERLLTTLDVGFVTLTGSTRERGEVVRRFNEDRDCRVFLGSLKAGGAGIDLVAGSVVLHYDRWWNAAREDQATDRVYRMGQTRAVQVFKLVTEGTLEEKISAIIERKRKLMDAVVRADDPHLSKSFTREEILEMLQPPV